MRILVVHFLGIRQFYVLKSLDRSLFAFLGAEIRMNLQNFFHLFSDLHKRIHGAHRFLKDYADLVSLYFAKERPVCVEHIFAVYQDVAPVITLFAGKEAGDAHRRDGFSGAGLSHKAQDLPVLKGEAHACHRFSVSVMKLYMEISDFQHQSTSLFMICSPSPIRLTPNTRSAITPPTLSAYQGAERNIPCASESI